MSAMRWAVPASSTLCIMLRASAAGAGDPCDFVTGSPVAFTQEQVKKCYESVPFRPDDLRNIVQVIEQHRSFSDLGEIYDARIGWQRTLSAVSRSSYASDFAMHEALKAEHKNFRNPHVIYTPASCYWGIVNAVIPFDFGMTSRFAGKDEQQVVFIEDVPYLPDEYQQFTGIDVRKFVGLKVVAINGIPALEYFRTFGREHMKDHEDDGGHINAILNRSAYSVRIGDAFDSIPERAADEYVFESRQRVRTRVRLPWMFVPSRALLGDAALPLTHGSAEFRDVCLRTPTDAQAASPGATLLRPNWLVGIPAEHRRHRHAMMGARSVHAPPDSGSFFEVPAEALDRGVQTIIPLADTAEVLQHEDHTTVLRVYSTTGWMDVARQGVAYACEHSRRLIVDVRGNHGGGDTVIEWLHRHLFPAIDAPVPAGKIVFRIRNDNDRFNEVLFNMAALDALLVPEGVPPCMVGIGPSCLVDPNTGGFLPLEEFQWFRWPSVVERRGGARVSLSRQVGLPFESQEVSFDAASCAGRFAGNRLIFLTDGTNASGGYFLPAAFKGESVIVTMGGLVGEPMAMGRARGGSNNPASAWAALARAIPELSGGALTFRHQYAEFQREVDSNMEMTGAYRKDRRTLHIEQPVESDIFVDLWSDSPATAGYVYQHVLDAVDSGGRGSTRR